MALLGQGFEDPRSAAVMALAGGLLRGDFGGGLLGANQAYAQSQDGAMKRQLAQAQLEESQAQTLQRRALAQKETEALARAQRQQAALPGLFRQPGLTGGQAVPQEIGGLPMFSKPMQAAPMQATPGGFDVQGAIREGFSPEQITAYSNLQNLGRPEVARTVDIAGPRGEKLTQAYDKFGQPIGQPMNAFEAAQFLNLGDKQVAAVPRAGMSLPVGMSPSDRDASARGWASVKLQQDRLKFDKEDPKLAWNADLGGFVNPRTREVLPAVLNGVPAKTGGVKLTEDQGKATGWLVQANNAWKNMQEVGFDKDGNITSAAQPGFNDVLANVPSFGLAGGAANIFRGADRQKFMQASSSLSEALLRAATGAGVNKDEAEQKVRELTPVIGEAEETTKQKMAAIPLYIESLKVRAGPGAAQALAIGGTGKPTMRFNPATGNVEAVK